MLLLTFSLVSDATPLPDAKLLLAHIALSKVQRKIVNIFPSRLSACLSGLLHTLRAVVVGGYPQQLPCRCCKLSWFHVPATASERTWRFNCTEQVLDAVLFMFTATRSHINIPEPRRTSNVPSAKLGLLCSKAQLPKHYMAASTCLVSYCLKASCHLKLRCSHTVRMHSWVRYIS